VLAGAALQGEVGRRAAHEPVAVSRELLELIVSALAFSELTGGAFDITYASAEQLQQVLPAIDYHHVRVDTGDGTVAFTRPGVRIDLGGIAKGYAVDRSIEILSDAEAVIIDSQGQMYYSAGLAPAP
jgi:thiamine biosynthesis lipoprotein